MKTIVKCLRRIATLTPNIRLLMGFALSVGVSGCITDQLAFDSAKNRFEELCATQAEENIFKTVEGVRGIVVMRPPEKYESNDEMVRQLWDQFALDDPYSFSTQESDSIAELYLYFYEFIEFPVRDWDIKVGYPPGSYIRMTRYKDGGLVENDRSGDKQCWNYYVARRKDPKTPMVKKCLMDTYSVKVESIPAPTARYGYTHHEVTTHEDREKWIAGSMVEVKDLQTGEILGRRTGFEFAKFPSHPKGQATWSLPEHARGRVCPKDSKGHAGRGLFFKYVLVPADPLRRDDGNIDASIVPEEANRYVKRVQERSQ